MLAASQREQALLERDKAVAQALADELRAQVEQERVGHSLLATRLAELESDRDDAVALLGWLGRQRYNSRRTPGIDPSSPGGGTSAATRPTEPATAGSDQSGAEDRFTTEPRESEPSTSPAPLRSR